MIQSCLIGCRTINTEIINFTKTYCNKTSFPSIQKYCYFNFSVQPSTDHTQCKLHVFWCTRGFHLLLLYELSLTCLINKIICHITPLLLLTSILLRCLHLLHIWVWPCVMMCWHTPIWDTVVTSVMIWFIPGNNKLSSQQTSSIHDCVFLA